MKWIRQVLWKIQSGHDLVCTQTDGRTDVRSRWNQCTPLTSLAKGMAKGIKRIAPWEVCHNLISTCYVYDKPLRASALCKTHLLSNRCPPWKRHNTMEMLSTLLTHRSQVDSLHKGSGMPIFQVSLMSVRTNYWQTLGWPTIKDAMMFPWRHCNTLKRTCLKICEQSAILFPFFIFPLMQQFPLRTTISSSFTLNVF